MHSHLRPFAFALLLVVLAATFTPAVAKTPIAPTGLPAQMWPAGARTTSAASPPAIEFVDSFGGIVRTFAVSGTTAFLIQGSALTVLNIGTPAAPTRIGHMPLVSGADTLAEADGIVYVAGYQTVQIIDAHNPTLPVEITRFQAHGAVDHIQLVGTAAYLMEGSDGVEILDISDPSRPIYLAQYRQTICSGCFLVVDNLAYVTDYSNVLRILDISNPVVPITRGTFTLAAPAQTEFWRVIVQGNRAYISALTRIPSGVQPRLVTLDITDPATPLLLGNAELPSPFVAIAGNIAYTKSDTQLQLLDVGDPAHPVARGAYTGTLLQVIAENVVGNRVYLADNLAALKILDVSNPDHPIVLGSYATLQGLKYPDSIQVVGSTGSVLSRGLQVLDLSAPISPMLRGYYPSEYALSVFMAGGRAYLNTINYQLELLDISNIDLPTHVSMINIGLVSALQEVNNQVYILASVQDSCGKLCSFVHNSLVIVDIRNPSVPQILNRIQLFDSDYMDTGSVNIKGAFAYIWWGGALRIVDLSTAATPVVRANYPLPAAGNQAQMIGNVAYVLSMAGLTILDLTDPLKPRLLGQTGSLGYAYSIQVQGSLAFVGSSSGVRVIDISDPKRPTARAAYGDAIGEVQVIGDIIYVAGGTTGFHVLRLYSERFPPPMFVPLARQ